MFDLKAASLNKDGYQLRITYNKREDKYFITGYIIDVVGNYGQRDVINQDGASLSFNNIEDAIKHITDYPESLKRLAGL